MITKNNHGNRKLILIYTNIAHVLMPVVILSSHLHLCLSNSLLWFKCFQQFLPIPWALNAPPIFQKGIYLT